MSFTLRYRASLPFLSLLRLNESWKTRRIMHDAVFCCSAVTERRGMTRRNKQRVFLPSCFKILKCVISWCLRYCIVMDSARHLFLATSFRVLASSPGYTSTLITRMLLSLDKKSVYCLAYFLGPRHCNIFEEYMNIINISYILPYRAHFAIPSHIPYGHVICFKIFFEKKCEQLYNLILYSFNMYATSLTINWLMVRIQIYRGRE